MFFTQSLFCGCSIDWLLEDGNTENTNFTTTFEISGSGEITNNLVYEGTISDFSTDGLMRIDINMDGDVWIIDGKEYKQQEDKCTVTAMNSYWLVDLEVFIPFGIGDNASVVFVQNGTSKEDVLLVMENDELFLLATSDDIMDPQKYSIDDFRCDSFQSDNDNLSLDHLWETHIHTNESNFVVFLDGVPSTMALTLKDNPALVYKFDYIEYGDKYYTSMPYNVKPADGSVF